MSRTGASSCSAGGHPEHVVGELGGGRVAVVGHEHDGRPPAGFTSAMLDRNFSHSGLRVAMPTTTVPSLDEGDRPVLELAGRVSLGMEVGELLQLERPLEGDRVADVATEVEEVLGRSRRASATSSTSLARDRSSSIPAGSSCRASTVAVISAAERVPRTWARVEGEQLEHHDLGEQRLGGGHADLRTGPGVEDGVGLPGDRGVDDVGDPEHPGPAGPRLAQREQGVERLARLAHAHRERPRVEHGVAVAELARDVDLGRHPGPLLDRELGQHRRVVAGAAGDQVDPGDPGAARRRSGASRRA